tara:strand:+ start:709 stop:879 length:171 start_codon:yes stop_codon:yes gene_type:complete
MKRLIESVVGFAMALAMAFLIVFVVINFMLNCQTWDQDLWTDTSSCVTLGQFLGVD